MFSTRNYERYLHILLIFCLFVIPSLSNAEDGDPCIPQVAESELYITYVNLNAIDHPSANEGYSYTDYPDNIFVSQGTYNYNLHFSISGSKYFAILMDINADGDFNDPGEVLESSFTVDVEAGGLVTMPVLPDADVETVIRVVVSGDPIYSEELCDAVLFPGWMGEIEDFPAVYLRGPDKDWDIIVSAGLFIPGHGSLNCGDVKFRVEAINCAGNTNAIYPYPLALSVIVYDHANGQTFVNPNPNLSYLQRSFSVSFSNGNEQDISVPIQNTPTPPFSPNKPYRILYGHDYDPTIPDIDDDCNNAGHDYEILRINKFPRCRKMEPIRPLIGIEDDYSRSNRRTEVLLEFSNDLKVMPNPFQESFSLNYQLAVEGPISIGVFDMLGKQVALIEQNTQHPSGLFQREIELSTLPPGAYYLVLQGRDFYKSEKLIKLN